MEGFEEEGKIVGIILDVSLRHEGGSRIIDEVKSSLVDLILKNLESDVDAMYLYHPDLLEILIRQGDQTSAINNYETDGRMFNVENALKQTIYVIGSQKYISRKYLILVTDRLVSERSLEKIVLVNKRFMIDAEIVVVGVGDHYDREMVSRMALAGGFEHFHFDNSRQLCDITKEKNDRPDFRVDGRCDPVHLSGGHHCTLPRTIRKGDAVDGERLSIDSE
jgi:hypothetical protein